LRVLLKTILTSEAELVFLAAQFLELEAIIDRMIIVEPEFTHTGLKRQRVGIDILLAALPGLSAKIEYIPLPMTRAVKQNAMTEVECHANERVTRGAFARYIDLSPRDVIVSTDADEVVYEHSVAASLERITSSIVSWRAEAFVLHQFVYKDTLIAPDFEFSGPCIVGCGRYFLLDRPFQWRYVGRRVGGFSGCHFSWCMPKKNLETKVRTFAHAPSYLLPGEDPGRRIEADILNKVYSFRTPPIRLTEVSTAAEYWPRGYLIAKSLFPQR